MLFNHDKQDRKLNFFLFILLIETSSTSRPIDTTILFQNSNILTSIPVYIHMTSSKTNTLKVIDIDDINNKQNNKFNTTIIKEHLTI